LDPLSFVRRDYAKVLRKIFDESPHWPRPSAAGQLGQHDRTATNDELQIQNFLFKTPRSQIVNVN